jgi:hypothetical protein
VRNFKWESSYGVAVGKKVMVSHEKYSAYIGAVRRYVGELIFRTGEKFGDGEIRQRARLASHDTQHQRPESVVSAEGPRID